LIAAIFGLACLKAEFQAYAGPIAGVFTVFNTASLKAITTFRSQEKSDYYGGAITSCDEYIQTLKYQVKNDLQFNSVLSDFKALRRREGVPSKKNA